MSSDKSHPTAADLPLILSVLEQFPAVAESIAIAKRVTSSVKFPVSSFDDLAEALGGVKETVTFRGRTMTVADIKKMVPAYYFPISSERDLIAKLAEMESRVGTVPPPMALPVVAGVDVKWAAPLVALPPGASPPPLTSQQVHESVKHEAGPSGIGRLP